MNKRHKAKIKWMREWCAKNNLKLTLKGECGILRKCVGVLSEDIYPDYEWLDRKTYERIDTNGEVFTPEDAYHKHPCVAVLGRGEKAEAQLYEWLQWFDKNNFVLETGARELDPDEDEEMARLFGQHRYARMVRKPKSAEMKEFRISLRYDLVLKAEDEEHALEKFIAGTIYDTQSDFATFVMDNVTVRPNKKYDVQKSGKYLKRKKT